MGFMKNQASVKGGKKKPKKPFGPIEVETTDSEPWRKLNHVQAHVYNTLKTFYHGNAEWFEAPFSALKRRTGIKHGATIDKALVVLEQKGWVEITRYAKHGKGRGLRVKANRYRLTFKFDYKRY